MKNFSESYTWFGPNCYFSSIFLNADFLKSEMPSVKKKKHVAVVVGSCSL